MREAEWQIGLFGTFDVQNYGDLLFPLIAQAELTERLGPGKLLPFSYHAKTPPAWPYTVVPLTKLPQMAGSLDAVLIGGGFIIRFDKEVAASYRPPTPTIHHPTGYWLTPALIALQHGIPLIWNAPGMHCNDIPSWADPLMELAFEHSRYITLRDEPSRAALARFVDEARMAVIPDTGFGIARLLDERRPSVEFSRLRETSGLTEPYIVVQATRFLDSFLRFVNNHSQRLRDFRFLVLPIGPVLGDHESMIGNDLPRLVTLDVWPHPLLLAELISHAAAVVGHSYHLAITALACGVPVFSSADLSVGKFTALSRFETVFSLPKESETDPQEFISRLGKTAPSSGARAALDQLAHHWDRIAIIVGEGTTDTQLALNRFWQSLPSVLEDASCHSSALETACLEKQGTIDELNSLLALARADRLEQQIVIDDLTKLLDLAGADLTDRQKRVDELDNLVELAGAERIEQQRRVDELNNLLELAGSERIEQQRRIDELNNLLDLARAEGIEQQRRIDELNNLLELARAERVEQQRRIAEQNNLLDVAGVERIERQRRIDELNNLLEVAGVERIEQQRRIDELNNLSDLGRAERIELQSRIDELNKLLGLARAEIVARDDRITRLYNSPSWKVTTPARFLMRNLKRLVGK